MWTQYWPVYERLEKEFCDLTFSIALNDSHCAVYSMRMAELLLRICSELENAAKKLLSARSSELKNVENMNFPSLGDHLCKIIKFQEKEVKIIWPYQSLTKTEITPFIRWDAKKVQYFIKLITK